ncbi:MAG TPA: HIT family protein [Nitrososphaeraceae archaeon]|nr:HIT family protein [Nitrososphaeraceae archaeon]
MTEEQQHHECIFCKVALKKIPTNIIIENDKAMAFLDAYPLSKGHTLIIPKAHYSKIQELDENSSQSLFNILWKITNPIENVVGVNSSTIAIHNGKEAGQEVPHVHIHVIPRKRGDGAGPVHSMFKNKPNVSSFDMSSIVEEIKKYIT